MRTRQKGFTLMEMIGVIAIISILASMATPMIFEAMRNARVSAQSADINVIRSAVARYYQDTGAFPVQTNANPAPGPAWTMLTSDHGTSPVRGWDGPYIDGNFQNHISPGNNVTLIVTGSANYQFDLDGDGTVDTSRVSVLQINGITDSDAIKLSDILDADSDGSGDAAWNRAGRVKRHGVNSNHANVIIVFISNA